MALHCKKNKRAGDEDVVHKPRKASILVLFSAVLSMAWHFTARSTSELPIHNYKKPIIVTLNLEQDWEKIDGDGCAWIQKTAFVINCGSDNTHEPENGDEETQEFDEQCQESWARVQESS